MSRTFTKAELLSLPHGDFLALPLVDREAFNRQWLDLCAQRTNLAEARYLSGDLDRIGAYRRYEIGE